MCVSLNVFLYLWFLFSHSYLFSSKKRKSVDVSCHIYFPFFLDYYNQEMEFLFDDDDQTVNENVNHHQNLSTSISNSSFSSAENHRQGTISLHQLLALRSSPIHQKKIAQGDNNVNHSKPLFIRRKVDEKKNQEQDNDDDESIQFSRPSQVNSQVFESPISEEVETDDSPQTQIAKINNNNGLVTIGRRKSSSSSKSRSDDSSASRRLNVDDVDESSPSSAKRQQMEDFLNSTRACAKCDETMEKVIGFLERESQRDAEIADLRMRLAMAEKMIEKLEKNGKV